MAKVELLVCFALPHDRSVQPGRSPASGKVHQEKMEIGNT
jgi:hypothetical protein